MNVEIRAREVDLAEAMRCHLQRRLRFALGRFENRIRRVTVRLLDVNGPRGGIDKQCRITLELIPSGNVVIQESSADLVAAIDRAADRIGHAISRKLHREKQVRDVSAVGT